MKTSQIIRAIGAALFVAVLSPGLVQATTTCSNGGEIWASKYIIINDMWNASCDSSGWECVWNNNSSNPLSWGTSYNWTTGCSQYQVKAYPCAVAGWYWGTWSSGSGLPVRLWNNTAVDVTGSYTISNPGIQDVSYDCWFHTSSSGGTPADEMMIWVGSYGGAGPLGTWQASVSIDGATWNVYRGWNSSGWYTTSFVRSGNTSSWSYNLTDFINYCVYTKGWMSNSLYLTSVGFGTEPFSSNGNGQLNVSNFQVNVQ